MVLDQVHNLKEKDVITLDGPSGSGKSTVAKKLANILHYFYLDTGAMYRALTYKAIQERLDLENEDVLVGLAQRTSIELESSSAGIRVLLDGVEVTQQIRTVDVTNSIFHISEKPRVREMMVNKQRQIAKQKNVVIEGRDTGTVVFPQAQYKFYIDADLIQRARRRASELEQKGNILELDQVMHQMNERDNRDKARSAGPLRKASDAVVIDSTYFSADEVVNQILLSINKTKERNGPS